MKIHKPITAAIALLLLAANPVWAQTTNENHTITPPSTSDWDIPSSAKEGDNVNIKYTGNKYVKSVKVVPRIESISIIYSCLTMFKGATVNLACKVALYKNSVLTEVIDNDKFVTWTSSDLSVLSVSETGEVMALQEGDATITATAANGKTDALTITVKKRPSNCVAGVFSVGECKHVVFSKGNLQYNVNDETWRLATNQWDYVGGDGTAAGTIPGSNNENVAGPWIDLFGWGMWLDEITDKTKITNSSGNYQDYSPTLNEADEFANNTRTVDGVEWKTLSYSEWNYLLFTRTNAANLYGVATVNGVNGLILLPDLWTDPKPDGVEFKSGFANDWSIQAYKTVNSYTAAQWIELESFGAVFLPAAGHREYISKRTPSHAYGQLNLGCYWTSTSYPSPQPRFARRLCFHSNAAYLDYYQGRVYDHDDRFDAFSIRLVRAL